MIQLPIKDRTDLTLGTECCSTGMVAVVPVFITEMILCKRSGSPSAH